MSAPRAGAIGPPRLGNWFGPRRGKGLRDRDRDRVDRPLGSEAKNAMGLPWGNAVGLRVVGEVCRAAGDVLGGAIEIFPSYALVASSETRTEGSVVRPHGLQ